MRIDLGLQQFQFGLRFFVFQIDDAPNVDEQPMRDGDQDGNGIKEQKLDKAFQFAEGIIEQNDDDPEYDQ